MQKIGKILKRLTELFCAFALMTVIFCGCVSTTDFTSDNFLFPPGPGGDMLEIQNALKESVGEKITLKYPTDGQYRSAYIVTDLMGTGKKEFALAFYSTLTTENVASMHLNLMKKVNDEWLSISNITIAATGVEKVLFSDMDNDGISEIIVGWNVYGGIDKRVAVYQIKGLSLVPLMQESYTEFMSCNLQSETFTDIFVLNHNSAEGSATARLYGLSGEKLTEIGNCTLDGKVTSFYKPVCAELSNGEKAIFVDAVKGKGTQTEILLLKDGKLSRAELTAGETGELLTYRNNSILCSDINGDGRLDIPLSESELSYLPAEYSGSVVGMVKWCSFDGVKFNVSLFAAMNYSDGYYLEIPNRWFSKITIETDVKSRTYTVSVWDTENNIKLGELFKLRTVSNTEWDTGNNGLEAYSEVARNGNLVYIAAVGNHSGEEKTSLEEIKKLIHIIE